MKTKQLFTLKTILALSLTLTSCGVTIHEDPDRSDGASSYKAPYKPTAVRSGGRSTTCNIKEEAWTRYTIQKNSRLEKKSYDVGDPLSGKIYVGSYEMADQCNSGSRPSMRERYGENVRNMWLEITQLAPFDPYFVKTYFIPEENVSFKNTSEETGIILDIDFVILDGQYQQETDYLIKVFVENRNGVVSSAGTWNNDMEAFQSLGFTLNSDESLQGQEQ